MVTYLFCLLGHYTGPGSATAHWLAPASALVPRFYTTHTFSALWWLHNSGLARFWG